MACTVHAQVLYGILRRCDDSQIPGECALEENRAPGEVEVLTAVKQMRRRKHRHMAHPDPGSCELMGEDSWSTNACSRHRAERVCEV